MKRVQDTKTIKQMLKSGEITFHDPQSGFKHTLCAVCPTDGNDCSIASFEKEGGDSTQIFQVRFDCPICSKQFTVEPEGMYLL